MSVPALRQAQGSTGIVTDSAPVRLGERVGRALVALLGLFALTAAQAAYLEQGEASSVRRPDPEPDRPIVRPIPMPEPETPLHQLVRRLEIGTPTPYRNLTVFPLTLRRSSAAEPIRTLDEALARHWIDIREKESAQVPEILVRNESKQNVFLMAGEIITGGRQNRILRDDTLLPPFSDFVALPVYCGEKERWAGDRKTFASPSSLADQGLRKMAACAESQGSIWSEIDAKLTRAKVAAPTRAYQDLYEDRGVDKELGRAVAELRRVCRRDTIGAVLVSGNRILCCDLFGDPDLFERLWGKICRSYAIETVWKGGELEDQDRRRTERAVREESYWRPRAVDREDIRRLLDQVLAVQYSSEYTPGAGQRIRLRGTVDGNVLMWHGEVIHAAVFTDGMRILER